MRKHLLSFLALALGIGTAVAGPVSQSQAKYVGQQFVCANFGAAAQSAELTLVQTGTSSEGSVCYYVYNVGSEGFVIVSADDNYRPIIGYSKEGIFDTNNMSPECAYYLGAIAESRSATRATGPVDPTVPTEWKTVTNTGKLLSRNNGRGVDFLVQAKWDQSPAPYNSMCPVEPASSDGHVVTGCVATAMAQLMSYWRYPAQGQGSHSYNHPVYGVQSVNFGQATYNWENVLNSYSGNYTPEQGELVSKISYHCGVAVDMNYDWVSSDPNSSHQGSGAFSETVPAAIANYFRFSTAASLLSRSSYTLTAWQDQLKEQFDMGWPVYYAGSGAGGGHAFICDGYDDADLFHFNWGWGGYQNGYFAIDALNPGSSSFNNTQRTIINFVPVDTYNNTPQAPTNFNVTPADNYELAASLTWVNPTKTMNNSNLTSIDQIVVTRDGEIIYTEENVTPGATMTVTDNSVPRFDAFNYKVYAVYNGAHGKLAYKNKVIFGPSCQWSIIINQASMVGFRGGLIHVYNSAGTDIAQVTTNTSALQTINIDVPLGMVSFGWSAPTQDGDFNMTFLIKNSENQTVYTYNGSSADMPVGVFFTTNNGCGNAAPVGVPSNLVARIDEENPNNVVLTWDGVREDGYGYVLYRDNVVLRLIPDATTFVDENATMGGHCYYVSFLGYGGENGEYSNESCVSIGECYAPRNITYQYTGSNNKIKLFWEKPEPETELLSGYYLYRRYDEDDEYTLIKVFGNNTLNYTDNTATREGWYFYKLYAFYLDLDECVSAPANWIGDENQFHLHVLRTFTGVDENEADGISVYPNPAKDSFTIEGDGLMHVTVFNTIGQAVCDMDCNANSVTVSLNNVESGLYTVRIATENGTSTKRISIVR